MGSRSKGPQRADQIGRGLAEHERRTRTDTGVLHEGIVDGGTNEERESLPQGYGYFAGNGGLGQQEEEVMILASLCDKNEWFIRRSPVEFHSAPSPLTESCLLQTRYSHLSPGSRRSHC